MRRGARKPWGYGAADHLEVVSIMRMSIGSQPPRT